MAEVFSISYYLKVYEGLVYMDFSKDIINAKGHGNYRYWSKSVQ